jgi:hypothetical protein
MNRAITACLFLLLLCVAGSTAYAQKKSPYAGTWIWKEAASKDKPQTQFTLKIRQKGNVFIGVYSVDEFINGVWQGEDGNQTPFAGRLKNGGLELEFDPDATVPGYQQNVKYKKPAGGFQPSFAFVRLSGKTLNWRAVRGRKIEGLPVQLTMRKS